MASEKGSKRHNKMALCFDKTQLLVAALITTSQVVEEREGGNLDLLAKRYLNALTSDYICIGVEVYGLCWP